ncbi:MAG: BMP family ABC transporter substrate-binding protein [Desulfovibrio sp.]|nr:BMP family ABC transporter substrate-binding protein [Desulfovibrio sp.]
MARCFGKVVGISSACLLCCWMSFFSPVVPQAAQKEGMLRVALLLEHDGGWSALLRRGLEAAAGELPLHAEVLTASEEASRTALFRKTADAFDLVIVASDGFHEILRDNAANYRKTMFGCVDAGIRAANIMSVTFADEQAAFLAGAAAAMLTARQNLPGINSERTLGWLSGDDTPAQRTLLHGFTEGARLVAPETRVINGMSGSFATTGRAVEETRRMLAQGADVIGLASAAGNVPALEIIRESGSYVVGLDEDQASALPGRVLTSIVKRADKAVREIVSSAASGHFRGKEVLVFDLQNGGVDITELFRGAPAVGTWPLDDARRRLGELRREIINGGIRIQSQRDRTLCDCL